MTNFDDFKLAVEALSGGKNTVLLDDIGMPSVVVPFPRLNYADVIAGGTQEPLPAFLVGNVIHDVIYQSKYQNIIMNERAYSLPFRDPAASLNFDRALTVCRNKGAGWHLQTNALWAAIALFCKRNNTMPRGNTNFGQDILNPHEKAVPSMPRDASNRIQRTATGSGPITWYHNYADSGIADLNGNVWEWCAGLRLMNGEIQIIPYGNAMRIDSDMSASSPEWQAILPNGTLVNPGTTGTLKWDYTGTPTASSTAIHLIAGNLVNPQPDDAANGRQAFGSLVAQSGVTIPAMLHALGLMPADADGYANQGHFWFRNNGERLPFRGGAWGLAGHAGVFALNLLNPWSYAWTNLGFRSAFVPL